MHQLSYVYVYCCCCCWLSVYLARAGLSVSMNFVIVRDGRMPSAVSPLGRLYSQLSLCFVAPECCWPGDHRRHRQQQQQQLLLPLKQQRTSDGENRVLQNLMSELAGTRTEAREKITPNSESNFAQSSSHEVAQLWSQLKL